jgi:hypothetical protein
VMVKKCDNDFLTMKIVVRNSLSKKCRLKFDAILIRSMVDSFDEDDFLLNSGGVRIAVIWLDHNKRKVTCGCCEFSLESLMLCKLRSRCDLKDWFHRVSNSKKRVTDICETNNRLNNKPNRK